MPAEYRKTAKDIAFDRERQKLRRRINELEEELRKQVIELEAKEAIEEHLNEIIDELAEENEKFKYMIGIPKEELEQFLKEVHEKAEREKKTQESVEALLKLRAGIASY